MKHTSRFQCDHGKQSIVPHSVLNDSNIAAKQQRCMRAGRACIFAVASFRLFARSYPEMSAPVPPRTRSVFWDDDKACIGLIDQKILPTTLELVYAASVADTIRVIKDMTVRGAPAIGAAGGFGMALAAFASTAETP